MKNPGISSNRFFSPDFLSKVSVLAACAAVFSFPFSFALFNAGLTVIAVLFILKRLLERDTRLFDPLMDGILLFYFAVCAVSVFTTDRYFPQALEGMQKLFRYLLVFAAAREIFKSSEDAEKVTAAFLAGGILTSLDGLYQLGFGTDFLRGRTPFVGLEQLIRITASFNNPNGLVIYLSFLIPLAGYAALTRKENRLFYLAAFILTSAAMCLTYSRTGLLALAGALILVLVLRRDVRVLLVLAASVIAGAFLLPQDIREWFLHLKNPAEFFFDISRSYHHQAAWNMISSHPWFGVGLNTFDINYGAYRAAGDTIERWSAHHGYLQMAAETGWTGLGLFLSFLTSVFIYVLRRIRREKKDSALRILACGFGFGLSAVLITGFFESIFWQPRQTYFFWLWIGCWCGIAKLAGKADGNVS